MMRVAKCPELRILMTSRQCLFSILNLLAPDESIRHRVLKTRPEIYLQFDRHQDRVDLLLALVDMKGSILLGVEYAEISTGTLTHFYVDDEEDLSCLLAAAEDHYERISQVVNG